MQPSAEQFFRTILRSRILTRDELQEALRAIPREQRAANDDIANNLIKQGKLTRFQAQKLLRGIGTGLVIGPFQLLAPIGKGGIGAVYLAIDKRSGKRVALKILPPSRARDGNRYLARFQREMELSQKVSHPNIAQTYDVGVVKGVYYIAMEFIPGENLFRLVASKGPLTVSRAARLCCEILEALDHAHRTGLVHRDLKPSNIIITPHDHAKLLDLGLALVQGETVEETEVVGGKGYIVGSMDYIAPEQTYDATQIDGRADIYGLGCTLYFALTGTPPFPSGSNRDKIRAHRQNMPMPIPDLNQSVPYDFSAVVERMMTKKPEDRFRSAMEARAALMPWAGREAEKPIDTIEDSEFQMAVAELEKKEVESEMLGESILESVADSQEIGGPVSDDLLELAKPESFWLDYWWIIAAFIGFWLLVMLCFGVVWLFR